MERITRFRARILAGIFILVVLFFAFKCYDLQILQTKGKTQTEATVTVSVRVKACGMLCLTENIPKHSFCIGILHQPKRPKRK